MTERASKPTPCTTSRFLIPIVWRCSILFDASRCTESQPILATVRHDASTSEADEEQAVPPMKAIACLDDPRVPRKTSFIDDDFHEHPNGTGYSGLTFTFRRISLFLTGGRTSGGCQ